MRATLLCVLAVLLLAAEAWGQRTLGFPVDPAASPFTFQAETPVGTSPVGTGSFDGGLVLELTGGGEPFGGGRIVAASLLEPPDLHVESSWPPLRLWTYGLRIAIASDVFAPAPSTGAFDVALSATLEDGLLIADWGGGAYVEFDGQPALPTSGSGTLLELEEGVYALELALTLRFPVAELGPSGWIEFQGTVRALHEPPLPECVPAPNSVGRGVGLATLGSTSISSNELVLLARGLPPFASGLFFYGGERTWAPFGDGHLCVGGRLARLRVVMADELGLLAMHLDQTLLPPGAPIAPGDTRHFQLWYRDPPGGPAGYNLSDALSLLFTP